MKRKIDIVVISDIHLGTFGCQANELLEYLDSIDPETLVLNGDIIDIWAFKKSYFPTSQVKVVQKILKMATKRTKVYYLLGNHDEALRKYSDLRLGSVKLCNKLILKIGNKKAWIFHGDIFDLSMKHTKWLAKLGGKGYDILIFLNHLSNLILEKFGYSRYSFSKKIKNSFKRAVQFVNDFEQTAIDLAFTEHYDYVICGHIHTPAIRKITREKREVIYLNSGDWVESLTALECNYGEWKLYKHEQREIKNRNFIIDIDNQQEKYADANNKEYNYEDTIFDPGNR